MDWFRTYSSNTLGGTGNQVQFDAETPMTGRIYYKIFAGGSYHYSLLFTGTVDSTYKPEYHCVANLKCGQWEILRACVGICKDVTMDAPGEVSQWTPLTFQGQPGIRVQPGAVFTSDPVVLNPEKSHPYIEDMAMFLSPLPTVLEWHCVMCERLFHGKKFFTENLPLQYFSFQDCNLKLKS